MDIVEPIEKFTDQARVNVREEIGDGRIGEIYNVLESWAPEEEEAYWVIWK